MKRNPYTLVLSTIITLLAAIAAAGGLWLNNLYQDNDFVKSTWYSNDIITLFIVVPLSITAIYLVQKGSQRWLLFLMGLLGYMFYNFLFYLFGTSFNVFFLIYAGLVSISITTLFMQLSNSVTSNLATKFNEDTPVKWLSTYLLLISSILFILELGMIVPSSRRE